MKVVREVRETWSDLLRGSKIMKNFNKELTDVKTRGKQNVHSHTIANSCSTTQTITERHFFSLFLLLPILSLPKMCVIDVKTVRGVLLSRQAACWTTERINIHVRRTRSGPSHTEPLLGKTLLIQLIEEAFYWVPVGLAPDQTHTYAHTHTYIRTLHTYAPAHKHRHFTSA